MSLALTILQQGQDYIFAWNAPSGAGSARAGGGPAATRRLATIHLEAQQETDLHSAINLAAQVANQLTEPDSAAGSSGSQGIQSLERLGRVMFSQLLPAPLQDDIRALTPASPLWLTTNDSALPWELLHDDQEFLTLRCAVGRQLLTSARARESPAEVRDRLTCLLIGNPNGDLPAADAEIEVLIDVLDAAPRRVRAELLCRGQASKVRVLEALASGQYDVVHYAGHARPGALRLADGWLETDEIRAGLRGHPLIFLNACASAQAKVSTGDPLPYAGQQARNLASAFLLGGASAFAGTLWPVFDAGAQALAADFYRAVVRGQAIGEALRTARTRYRRGTPGEIVWASLVLYGDPLQRVMTSGLSHHSGTALVIRLPDPPARWREAPTETAARAAHGEIGRLAREITAYGGQITALGSHQITAVFGVPRTFEDDAERALRAALGIQHATVEWGAGQPAIGVASGEIVAGTFNSAPTPSAAAGDAPVFLGPAVTEAVSLAQQAQAGQVLAGTGTRRLAWELFHFAPIAGEPLETYEVTPARQPIGLPEVEQSLDQVLIGRAEELDALAAYWRAARSGRGQVVGVVGEAGIGKTRLLQTFREAVAEEDHVWLEAACPATGHEAPYTLLAQLLRALLAISPADDASAVERKIKQRLDDLPGAAGAGPELVEVLKETLGLTVSASSIEERKVRRGRLVYLLRGMLADVARQAPLIVALEDMHWADEASLEILDQVTDGINRLPVQILVIYRPEWDHPWFHKPYYRHLALEPLDEAASVQLLRSLLGSEVLPQDLLRVIERTGGNPFFTEELVKSLQESEVLVREDGTWTLTQPLTEAQLPGTVQRTLQARFDRLPADTRRVLQVAAVIGPSFAPELLAEVLQHLDPSLDHHLAELEDRGFAYSRWDTGDYVFRHALIQEVAYHSLPAGQRRVYHRRIGETLEQRGDRFHADVETLAHHFYHSLVIPSSDGQPLVVEDADPAQLRKATGYLTQAGHRARERYAAREALNYYRRGLTVSQRAPENEDALIGIYEGASEAHHILSNFDEAIGHLRHAVATLHTRPLSRAGRRRAADLARRIGFLCGWRGEYEAALEWMQEGLRRLGVPENDDDRATAALLHIHTAVVHYFQGNLDTADQQCRLGLELAERIDLPAEMAAGFNTLGAICYSYGEMDEALSHYKRSLNIWRRQEDTYQIARVENNIGNVHSFCGNWETAQKYFERSLAFWEQVEDQDWTSRVCLNLGSVYLYRGDPERGLEHYRRALQLAEKVGNQRMVARSHNNLGLFYIEQGDWDRAQAYLESGENLQEHLNIRDMLPETYYAFAEVALREREVDRAIELAQEATTLASELGMHFEHALALRTLGRAYAAKGELRRARTHLEASLAELEGLRSQYEVGRTLYQLALLDTEEGRDQENQDHLQRAIMIFQEVGAPRDLKRARRHAKQLNPT